MSEDQNSEGNHQHPEEPDDPSIPEIASIPTKITEQPNTTLEEPLPEEFVSPPDQLPESTNIKKMLPLIKEAQRQEEQRKERAKSPSERPGPPALPTKSDTKSDAPIIPQSAFELFEELTRDEYGRTLRARDLRLDRPVALREALRRTGDSLFLREAKLTARLQHSGILPVYEVGRWSSGDPIFVTQLPAGKTLSAIIQELPKPQQRLAFLPRLLPLINIISYAHSEGVVHATLRPEHVLLGGHGELAVVGWGNAQVQDEPPLVGVMHEPGFSAPEQFEGHTATPRADVYALGALLYALLAGATPQPNSALSSLAPWVPPALLEIISRAMSREPEKRFASAQELSAELTLFTQRRFVEAYVPPLPMRVLRAVRQRWVLLPLLLALLAGLVITRSRLSTEKSQAQSAKALASEIHDSDLSARALAEQRSALLTLLFSYDVLGRDPTYALALLTSLPDVASAVPLAHLITADAQSRGVAKHILQGHKGPISRLAASPDGNTLASASDDQTVRLWTVSTGAGRVLEGHQAEVSSLVFSPDGKLLASVSKDKTLRLWSVEGEQVRLSAPLQGEGLEVRFSPDGTHLAAADSSGAVSLWEVACAVQASPCAPQVTQRHQGDIYALRFSPDSAQLASAGKDRKVQVARVDGSDAMTFDAPSEIWALAFSPDGQSLASSGKDSIIRLWSLTDLTLKKKPDFLVGHSSSIPDIVFSADGRLLASASYDDTVRLWALPEKSSRVFKGHKDRVYRVAFSPDGTELASASKDGTLRRWDLSCLSATDAGDDAPQTPGICGPLQVLRGQDGPLSDIAVVNQGAMLASASRDMTIRLWELTKDPPQIWRDHDDDILALELSADDRLLATASADKTARLWEVANGQSQVLSGHKGAVSHVVFSPDGKHLLSSSKDELKLWDLSSMQAQTLPGHSGDINAIVASPDGQLFASASNDKTIKLWTLDGKESKTLRGHTDSVADLAFSPDSKQLASASKDKTVKLWTLADGSEEVVSSQREAVNRVAFSPDGRWLASAGKEKAIHLWELASRQEKLFTGHEAEVSSLAFSPDSKQLASASADKTIRLWTLARDAVKVFAGHSDKVRKVIFSADGLYLLSASDDGTARRWEVSSGLGQIFNRHKSAALDVASTKDGARLFSVSRDKTIRIFRDALPNDLTALRSLWSQTTTASIDDQNQLKRAP